MPCVASVVLMSGAGPAFFRPDLPQSTPRCSGASCAPSRRRHLLRSHILPPLSPQKDVTTAQFMSSSWPSARTSSRVTSVAERNGRPYPGRGPSECWLGSRQNLNTSVFSIITGMCTSLRVQGSAHLPQTLIHVQFFVPQSQREQPGFPRLISCSRDYRLPNNSPRSKRTAFHSNPRKLEPFAPTGRLRH